ncbi:TonB-dependent receptor [Pseudoxanthomonas suwonensis]|uniref:TonB-dependent receptor n=1 Tax=Pseudoxanthomonas suwonensis TaxID=314722 RepID=UPI0009E2737E|nr:TonB-dependent receptor [Pseudoxanthomonas suwonensis]
MRIATAKHTLLSAAVASCLWMLTCPSTAFAQATEQAITWNVPAGPLDQALRRAMSQGRLSVSYAPELVAGKTTRGVSGAHAPAEALRQLLDGTGLAAEAVSGNAFALRPAASGNQAPAAPSGNTEQRRRPETTQTLETATELERMTVTGTRIRGVQPSSPLLMISQEDMRLAGHHNLGDVIRAIPQNFSGGQNPGVLPEAGAGQSSNTNITGASSLNLRGLGPDATLTLLNGARLPYDGGMQATDVAVIPVAAIDRFEVLLDGASAIYGSDAVGGVANIILKRDYDGAELTARYGEATSGGYEQTQVSAVVGTAWSSGSLLIAGETLSSSAVRAAQRDYMRHISHPDQHMIYPAISQDGILVSGYQNIGSRTELTLDAFYTKRTMRNYSICAPAFRCDTDVDLNIYGLSPSIRISLPADWSMRMHAFSGEDEARTFMGLYSLSTGALVQQVDGEYINRTDAAGVEFEGALFNLLGGEARLSLGGGWRNSEYVDHMLTGGSIKSRNLFTEINLPLVGESGEVPLVHRLSLSGAVRYDDYDRFGGATTPKVGALWQVTPNVDIRASWGKSFKAPKLLEQFQERLVFLYAAETFGIPNAASSATVLMTSGGNPDLGPERAEIATAGIMIRPAFLPGASVELGWFDIDYRERVVAPFPSFESFSQALADHAYDNFITRDPTNEQQQVALQTARFSNRTGGVYDPESVIALFENNWFNASRQRVRGVDLDMKYATPAYSGLISFNLGGSWITDSKRQLIEGLPEIETAGVVWFPPRFKGRAGGHWSRNAFSAGVIVNYLGGVRDTQITPNSKGSSMTTLDLVFDYAADPNFLSGFGLNLSITNAFDESPPYMVPFQSFHASYDSTNYSALGRVISLGITKRF